MSDFEDQDQEKVPGLKLDKNKSRFARKPEIRKTFEEKVEEVHQQRTGYRQQLFELGKQFLNNLTDRTLVQNKGPIKQSLEKEIHNKLVNLAVEINNDSNEQQDGMGSISLIVVLMKCIFMLRDRCNQLEFEIESLQSKLNKDAYAAELDKMKIHISALESKIDKLNNES